MDDVDGLRTGATSVLADEVVDRFDVLAEVWTTFGAAGDAPKDEGGVVDSLAVDNDGLKELWCLNEGIGGSGMWLNDLILLGTFEDVAAVAAPFTELELGVPFPFIIPHEEALPPTPTLPSSLNEVEDEAKFDMKLYKFRLFVDPVDGVLVRWYKPDGIAIGMLRFFDAMPPFGPAGNADGGVEDKIDC